MFATPRHDATRMLDILAAGAVYGLMPPYALRHAAYLIISPPATSRRYAAMPPPITPSLLPPTPIVHARCLLLPRHAMPSRLPLSRLRFLRLISFASPYATPPRSFDAAAAMLDTLIDYGLLIRHAPCFRFMMLDDAMIAAATCRHTLRQRRAPAFALCARHAMLFAFCYAI